MGGSFLNVPQIKKKQKASTAEIMHKRTSGKKKKDFNLTFRIVPTHIFRSNKCVGQKTKVPQVV